MACTVFLALWGYKEDTVSNSRSSVNNPFLTYFPASLSTSGPKLCSSLLIPAHSSPASPNCSLFPKCTMLSHAFAILSFFPGHSSTQRAKLTNLSFFKTQPKCHLFREVFSNSLFKIGHLFVALAFYAYYLFRCIINRFLFSQKSQALWLIQYLQYLVRALPSLSFH